MLLLNKYKFLFLTLLTIVVTRVYLYSVFVKTPQIGFMQDTWHHAYTATLLLIAYITISKVFRFRPKWYLTAILVGLIIDEIYIPLCKLNILSIDYFSLLELTLVSIGFLLFSLIYFKFANSYATR